MKKNGRREGGHTGRSSAMGVVSRSVGNAFRNKVRSGAVVVILAVAIGLALAMLVANQAVGAKVDSLKSSVGNTITVNPAGSRGGLGGGNPLTAQQLEQAQAVAHVTSATGVLTVRLGNTDTTGSSAAGTGTGGAEGGAAQPGRGGPGFGTSGTTSLVSAVAPGSIGQRNNSNGSTGTAPNASAPPSFSIPIQATGVATSATAAGSAINITGGAGLNDFAAASTQALVGSTLAEKNSLKVGSTFTVQDRTMTVKGLFDAGDAFENNGIYLPLAATQSLMDQAGQLSSFSVQVDSIDNVTTTQTALTTALGADKVDVTAGSTNLESAISSLGTVQNISLIAFIASLGTAGLIVLLIMIMVVRERRREIGVLKAIGASNRTIGVQFVLEAMVLVVLGTVVGAVVATFASSPIANALVSGNTSSGTTAAGPAGGPGGLGGGGGFSRTRGAFAGAEQLIGTISTSIGWQTLVLGGIGVLAIAAIGALIPALLTAKVRPIEVLRGE